ncbi:hypothetical protein SAMN04324258_1814 [Krasilnikoviella flava]|uniref:Uncharacterized protein n=1 Tax=Krasilnikoviella flava TaxID=526729 RepID=A0A1T5K4F5_9MICO|nr:hypothetical protein SAMN04324258_1814 [Krasilnikoviella flava]
MTLQDDFVTELQHAADRVEPVAALDGAAMGRRAVRRVRARRAALTGVGALAAVGTVAGVWQVTSTGGVVGPASSPDVPDGWTPVAVGGVRLAVPPGLEPSRRAGVWEQGPDDDGGDFVQVQPAGADAPLVPPGSGLTPVDVRVPGAESARYVVEEHGDDPTFAQDFLGRLQVTLESGDVVQVSLVWVDGGEGEEIFADLVASVSADEDSAPLPDPDGEAELQPLDGFAAGVPAGWEETSFAGLEYALPRGWAADESVADAFPAGERSRSASADGSAAMTVALSDGFARWPESIASSPLDPASTFPLDGADVVQVETMTADGVDSTTAHVRREGGRGYIVTLETPGDADGRALTRQLLGTLGFSAEAATVPGPEDLPEFQTTAVPDGWRAATVGGVGGGALRLALPGSWSEGPPPDGVDWAASGPDETVTVMAAAGDVLDTAPAAGYRYDVPGADAVALQVGDDTTENGQPCFLGTVELRRGDDAVVLSYYGPRGEASHERFASIVRSLRLSGS